MIAHFENQVMSSLLLFIDNKVCKKGKAFTNHGSYFYNVDDQVEGSHSLSAPFKQLVVDTSLEAVGADVMTGVFLGVETDERYPPYGTDDYPPTQTSGPYPYTINHYQGQLTFEEDHKLLVSGDYSVKDFNIYLTSLAEEQLLFETKFSLNPATEEANPTGLAPDAQTYPAIFIKNNGGQNEPFAFGGADDTIINARAIILADSTYELDAVCGILKDTARESLPLIENDTLPFDARGAYTGELFNYNDFKTGLGMNISDVFVSKVMSNRGDFTNLNPDVYSAFVDFELRKVRTPRAS
jgi:hypothetical protein